jgi:excisionase family DNA binding protein
MAGIISGGSDSSAFAEIVARLNQLQETIFEILSRLDGTLKDPLTVDEFAELTARAPYTVRAWIKKGLLRAERVAGTGPKGRLLIRRDELKRLIAAHHKN